MRRDVPSDAELLAACRRGEHAAFGTIVERYQRAVCAVAYSTVRDSTLVEDIAQDTFVTAWRKLDELHDIERLPAWLCGIARNLARARKRRRKPETTDVEVASAGTAFDALSARETEAAVAAALERVPDTYREPLVLYYCEQQSVPDVARALGLSDDAIHQRLSRGRQFLAADLAELVGRTHSERRPRRALAAAVVAAIALIGRPSHVEAKPRTEGWTMLKVATFAAVAAGLGGATYAVARARADEPDRSASRTATVGATSSSHTRGAHGFSFGMIPRASAGATTPTTASGAPAADEVTCATTARHMAVNQIEPHAEGVPLEVHERIVGEVERQYEAQCTKDGWSHEYMACVLGAPDAVSAAFDCAAYAPANLSGPTPTSSNAITIPQRTTPVPPTSDTSCAGVARHMAELGTPDEAALAIIPADQRQAVIEGMQRSQAPMIVQFEKACVDTGWTEALRTCFAQTTTFEMVGGCFVDD